MGSGCLSQPVGKEGGSQKKGGKKKVGKSKELGSNQTDLRLTAKGLDHAGDGGNTNKKTSFFQYLPRERTLACAHLHTSSPSYPILPDKQSPHSHPTRSIRCYYNCASPGRTSSCRAPRTGSNHSPPHNCTPHQEPRTGSNRCFSDFGIRAYHHRTPGPDRNHTHLSPWRSWIYGTLAVVPGSIRGCHCC